MEGAGVGRLEGFECCSEMLARVRHKLLQHNATEPKNTKENPYFCKDVPRVVPVYKNSVIEFNCFVDHGHRCRASHGRCPILRCCSLRRAPTARLAQ